MEAELLAAIRAAPDDDEPRLVYADWMSERDPARGELIALQVRLARADAEDARLPNRRLVTARIRALLKQHEASWTEPLRAITPGTYTVPARLDRARRRPRSSRAPGAARVRTAAARGADRRRCDRVAAPHGAGRGRARGLVAVVRADPGPRCFGGKIDDAAIEALVEMTWPALVELRLGQRLGDPAKRRLSERFGDALA